MVTHSARQLFPVLERSSSHQTNYQHVKGDGIVLEINQEAGEPGQEVDSKATPAYATTAITVLHLDHNPIATRITACIGTACAEANKRKIQISYHDPQSLHDNYPDIPVHST
ncbi:uncharacterized protein MELLADRAFT_107707 [Melampsora larici-populina 98AG31]|uniref:Uncharacterized protein n=1 Tax=Melampsora larici-populina (strain 98AG31 / pathotype 3-4-7) TaxID=747676 RepID=F4RQP2_MELLP|nr:uncharacterized protein MELLADRAFT_107707 [Melampsora larici-populina 98AG31]EGG05286.1 hypothetical protein MELLADRAFT_107707 [Melampsora larici-populina 98AG31]